MDSTTIRQIFLFLFLFLLGSWTTSIGRISHWPLGASNRLISSALRDISVARLRDMSFSRLLTPLGINETVFSLSRNMAMGCGGGRTLGRINTTNSERV